MSNVVDLNEYRELKAAKVRNEEYMRSIASAKRGGWDADYFRNCFLKKPTQPETTK